MASEHRRKNQHPWASGYTGAELVQLLLRHPRCRIACSPPTGVGTVDGRCVSRNSRLRSAAPRHDRLNRWTGKLDLNVAMRCLGRDRRGTVALPEVVDLSADFRLKILPLTQMVWPQHHALSLQKEAVLGCRNLSARHQARLVANPGCYTTCAIAASAAQGESHRERWIVIDTKSA